MYPAPFDKPLLIAKRTREYLREIGIGYGYCSGQEAIAHFGLGKVERVDIEVTLPHGKGAFKQKAVAANQRVTLKRASFRRVGPKTRFQIKASE